jgi:hypothetical protein
MSNCVLPNVLTSLRLARAFVAEPIDLVRAGPSSTFSAASHGWQYDERRLRKDRFDIGRREPERARLSGRAAPRSSRPCAPGSAGRRSTDIAPRTSYSVQPNQVGGERNFSSHHAMVTGHANPKHEPQRCRCSVPLDCHNLEAECP